MIEMDSTKEILIKAKATKSRMSAFGEDDINRALESMAKSLIDAGADILAEICRVHAVSADWLLGLSEERGTSAASPPPSTINLEELRETATQLAGQAAELAGTIKKLKKML